MAARDNWTSVPCRKIRDGENAMLIEYEEEELWIPYSQIKESHFDGRGEGHVVMTVWIAARKGIEV